MKYRWNQIYNTVNEASSNNENCKYFFLRKNVYPNISTIFIKDDKISISMIPFTLEIDMNQDRIRECAADFEASIYENATQQENNMVNVDYIKIQTIVKVSRIDISNKELIEDIRLIDKDVDRTGYLMEINKENKLNEKDSDKVRESLRNILITFAAYNQRIDEGKFELGYAQGMNELASIFLSVFNEESVAYWCFSNFMLLDSYSTSGMTLNTTQISTSHILKTNVAFYFSNIGVVKKLKHLSDLLAKIDAQLFNHLKRLNLDNLFFCHEWLVVYFKRCFSSRENYQHCFELINSRFLEFHTSVQKNISPALLYSFDLFICLAFLEQIRERILSSCDSETDFYELFKKFNKSDYFEKNFELILKNAEDVFNKYCVNANREEVVDLEKLENAAGTFKTLFNMIKEFY
jgi:hypothetical protein